MSLYRQRRFTLIELLVAMVILSIMMLGLMQMFGATQKLWNNASSKTLLFENGRIAMDLISTDLQCMYYSEDCGAIRYRQPSNDAFGCATVRSDTPNENCKSRIAIVYYRLNEMKLQTLVVGDYTTGGTGNADWRFSEDGQVDHVPESPGGDWSDVIDNVLSFKITPMNRTMSPYVSTSALATNKWIPHAVRIDLELIDRNTRVKIMDVLGKSSEIGDEDSTVLNSSEINGNEAAKRLADESKRTFTRIVIIDRGQF